MRFAKMHREIDTDALVDEIEKRPAIWNSASAELYRNKALKRQCWEEIVSVFCDESDSKEKKKYTGVLLQNKWKNMRDNYVRVMKKEKFQNYKIGQCSYISKLHFLKNIYLSQKENEKNDETDTDANVYNDPAPSDLPPKVKKIKTDQSDNRIIKILEKSMRQRQLEFAELTRKNEEVVDEDKLFCLSLVNEIKKIPEHRRLKAKIDVLNVLLQYQNMHELDFASSVPNYSSQYGWHVQPCSENACATQDVKPGTPLSTASSDESTIELFINKVE